MPAGGAVGWSRMGQEIVGHLRDRVGPPRGRVDGLADDFEWNCRAWWTMWRVPVPMGAAEMRIMLEMPDAAAASCGATLPEGDVIKGASVSAWPMRARYWEIQS